MDISGYTYHESEPRILSYMLLNFVADNDVINWVYNNPHLMNKNEVVYKYRGR